jgi:hypothetical protein
MIAGILIIEVFLTLKLVWNSSHRILLLVSKSENSTMRLFQVERQAFASSSPTRVQAERCNYLQPVSEKKDCAVFAHQIGLCLARTSGWMNNTAHLAKSKQLNKNS